MSYQTLQRKQILSFMSAHRDTPMTIAQLSAAMHTAFSGAAVPGQSTVYRVVTKLVEEGQVKRFVRGNSRQFVYQLVNGAECHCHLHMKCIHCGRLLHMDVHESQRILKEVQSSDSFIISAEQTTLFGCCKDCK